MSDHRESSRNTASVAAAALTVVAGLVATWIVQRRYFFDRQSWERVAASQRQIDKTLIGFLNLQQADLSSMQIPEAIIGFSNLGGANFEAGESARTVFGFTSLVGVQAAGSDLRGAVFGVCQLDGADFTNVNLQDAILDYTSARGANFSGANWQGAQLKNMTFDVDTILPDGTGWQLEDDLGRFTDASRSDFWRSNDPSSPAFRGAV